MKTTFGTGPDRPIRKSSASKRSLRACATGSIEACQRHSGSPRVASGLPRPPCCWPPPSCSAASARRPRPRPGAWEVCRCCKARFFVPATLRLRSNPTDGPRRAGPRSELRAATSRQLELRRGRLHAFIWAPPREFVVETASARAVDLGCQYTLDVDGAGNGLLRVETGWVAFQSHGHESFIPAGAACPTRQRQGPGIPFYEDAPEAFTAALRAYESGDDAALVRVLAAARPRDGLTLWHLLAARSGRCARRGLRPLVQLIGGPARTARRRGPWRCQDARPVLERTQPGRHRLVARLGTPLAVTASWGRSPTCQPQVPGVT